MKIQKRQLKYRIDKVVCKHKSLKILVSVIALFSVFIQGIISTFKI